MHTYTLSNRIRRFLAQPETWQLPPEADRLLWFMLGFFTASLLPMLWRAVGLMGR
jgi:hypothetical protein